MQSCQRLGATWRYFEIPDCVYRRNPGTNEPMYPSEASLNGPLQASDARTIDILQEEFQSSLDPSAKLVCPLALGNHVDHQLTRTAADRLQRELWYYADFPYVLSHRSQLDQLPDQGLTSQVFPVSTAGLEAWTDSIGLHASQISTFWKSFAAMRQAITDYVQWDGGIRLWRRQLSK